MEMGADDYLTKPFGRLELLNAIESRLKEKRMSTPFYSKSLENLDKLVAENRWIEKN
jgi:DNA-binding response OmpR family regulator